MTDHDLNDIERLIVRKLDGELSSEQSLELDRELLRNPQARQLFDDYMAIDAITSATMEESYAAITPWFDRVDLPQQVSAQSWSSRKRYGWLIIGAVAAAVLALMIPVPSLNLGPQQSPQIVQQPGAASPMQINGMQPVTIQPNQQDGMMKYVDWRQPRIQRDNGREIIGVQGDDGNLYWIEVNRTRTIRKPKLRMVPTNEWGQM